MRGTLEAPLRAGHIERIYRRGIGQTPVVVVGREEDRARVRRMIERAPGAYALAGEVGCGDSGVDLAALRGRWIARGAGGGPGRRGAPPRRGVPGAPALRAVARHPVAGRAGGPRLDAEPPAVSRAWDFPSRGQLPRLDNSQRALKRALDVTVSLGGLLLLSPLFLAVALR